LGLFPDSFAGVPWDTVPTGVVVSTGAGTPAVPFPVSFGDGANVVSGVSSITTAVNVGSSGGGAGSGGGGGRWSRVMSGMDTGNILGDSAVSTVGGTSLRQTAMRQARQTFNTAISSMMGSGGGGTRTGTTTASQASTGVARTGTTTPSMGISNGLRTGSRYDYAGF
jgi:hypothetical protein